MKRTLRQNISGLPYSLHDMHITEMAAQEGELILRFAEGFEKLGESCVRVPGELRFAEVDWDFSYAYVLDFWGNCGPFQGQKYFLADFVAAHPRLDLEIVDENYGYNSSKFAGYIYNGAEIKECTLEIYHLSDMSYLTEE